MNLSPGLAELVEKGCLGEDDGTVRFEDLESALPWGDGFIQASPIENLDVISAGNASDAPSQVLRSTALSRLFRLLKDRYRFVIVDLPAINDVESALRVASACDGAILVIEAGRVRWEVIQSAREQLASSRIEVLGAVLNKRRFPVPKWIYRMI